MNEVYGLDCKCPDIDCTNKHLEVGEYNASTGTVHVSIWNSINLLDIYVDADDLLNKMQSLKEIVSQELMMKGLTYHPLTHIDSRTLKGA